MNLRCRRSWSAKSRAAGQVGEQGILRAGASLTCPPSLLLSPFPVLSLIRLLTDMRAASFLASVLRLFRDRAERPR